MNGTDLIANANFNGKGQLYSFDKTLDLPARSCMLLIRGHTKENKGLSSSHRNLFYRLAFSYNSNLHVEAAKYNHKYLPVYFRF